MLARALVFGVESYVDPQLASRPGTTAATRRLAERLTQGGFAVRLLVDDAARESERPVLANLLEALAWVAQGPKPLVVVSAGFRDDVLLPRDARLAHVDRTGFPLSALVEALPSDARLILDGAPSSTATQTTRWAIGSAAAPPPDSRGPTPFLRAVGQALWSGGSQGVRAVEVANAAARVGSAWAIGALDEPLLGAIEDGPRTCSACEASVPDPSSIFCPACGASLAALGTLDGGRYVLLSLLGEGGMGQVYLAEDTRLKVRRAIKLLSLPPDLPAEEVSSLRARMIQEARAAQALAEESHHVVRVFDVGFSPERDEPFLVMELLEGETLTQRLKRGAFSLRAALALARTMAETLSIAHARGFVHRDLKPDNIMLVRRGAVDDHVKLLDFGLVKMEHAEVNTVSGRMMGTLQYMPPEQLRGQKVDARADVFSFGAVLYECVSGRRANPGTTQKEIFSVLLDTGVEPLNSVAPNLPAGLTDLIDACLAMDRQRRPADAGAVLAGLANIQTSSDDLAPTLDARDLPISVVTGEVSEVPQMAARPVWPWVIALAGLVGVAFAFWPNAEPPPKRQAAAAVVRVDAAPIPDAQIPDAAPPLIALKFPTEWPAIEGVEATLTDSSMTYRGGTPGARAAAWIRDSRGLGALNLEWNNLVPETRAWLAKGLTTHPVMDDGKRLVAPHIKAPARLDRAADFARWLILPDQPPLILKAACGDIVEGNRLVTARWSTPGYGGAHCNGSACAPKLARALLTARRVGESLRVTLKVQRGKEGADEAGKTETVRCRVRR